MSAMRPSAMRGLLLFLVVGGAWLAACRPADRGGTPALVAPNPAVVTLGEAVYAAQCASCHGAALEGEADWKAQNEDGSFRAPPHDASGHTWHHGDETLMEAIRLGGARFDGVSIGGTSNMPAFAEVLSEEEMVAVLAFIKSTWPADLRGFQAEATAREAGPAGGG